MPFASKKQARFLAAKKPEVFEEFARKTHNFKKLPEDVDTAKGKKREPLTKRMNRLIAGN